MRPTSVTGTEHSVPPHPERVARGTRTIDGQDENDDDDDDDMAHAHHGAMTETATRLCKVQDAMRVVMPVAARAPHPYPGSGSNQGPGPGRGRIREDRMTGRRQYSCMVVRYRWGCR